MGSEEDIPGRLPLSFQEKQDKLHLPHLRAVVPMHRTQGRHRTIDVTMVLTPVTFRVPEEVSHQFGLSWYQFVTGGTVENPIRDGNDQPVMKDETKNMCRVTESTQKQHGKISKPTSHFTSLHHMVTIYHQDTIAGQDNDHLHLTDSHFSQDDQRCDNSSSLSHDTGSFSLSNTISSVDLTTWGPDVRCHNQGGDRWARLTLLLWSQREEHWRERVKSGNMVGTIEPSTCSHPTSARQKGANQFARWENCTKCQQRLSTEKRDYWQEAKVLREKALDEEMARRMQEQKNGAFRSAPRRPRHEPEFPLSN